MTRRFSVQRGATRVVFERGAAKRIAEHMASLSVRKSLVVSTKGRRAVADGVAKQLGAVLFADAREHVPVEVVREARRELDGADAVVAIGGGSAIGLAKALAIANELSVIAVPTTYSGSEMTAIYGTTEAGEKRTGRDERVRPKLVIYDPSLTAGLPREVTVYSLWNAMAHAVEASWTEGIDRATERVAEDALGLLASAMRRLLVSLDDRTARDDALEGAYLAGVAFSDTGSGIHHKLCHVLGGRFALPHAATHAVMLPHVARAMRSSSPRAMAIVARALQVIDPIAGLEALSRASGVPRSLAALGMPRNGIDRVVEAMQTDIDVRALLEGAFIEAASSSTALRAPDTIDTLAGALSVNESEALPGALPRTQNTPRVGPLGLYPELVNLTPFTTHRADNLRLWLYRIRPSFSHSPLTPLPSARFATELTDVEPNRMRWRPLEVPGHATDWLDGLVTLGASGSESPGFAVHLYAANSDMVDRCFANADGDLLIVPQTGVLDVRTELGWLRAAPGSALMIPRGIKFAVGVPGGAARGWVGEVFGSRFRLPERGPLGSNGLADARHLRAPVASFEDRLCPNGFQFVTKIGNKLFGARQEHSPFDVVAWHGMPAPFSYDLALFASFASASFDHADPSIHTVFTAPLDDRGRAVADFVAFTGRWDVAEHTFRPPPMHRNAATEINCVVRDPSPSSGYDPGVTFLTPLLTSHGVTTRTYDKVMGLADDVADQPRRIPDASLWVMFESALHFRPTKWARTTPLLDGDFDALFEGMKKRFLP